MRTLKLEIPDSLVKLWGSEEEMKQALERDLIEMAVLELVRRKKISSRKGAELLNIDWQEFLDLMTKSRIPYFDYTDEELDKGLDNIDRVLGKTSYSSKALR